MVGAERGTRSEPSRRTPRVRALVALASVGLLALFALAVLLVSDHLAGPTHALDVHASSTSVGGDSDHSLPVVHVVRAQPSARARAVAFIILTFSALVLAAVARGVVRSAPGAFRTLRVRGRPPGRAPPRLHIA